MALHARCLPAGAKWKSNSKHTSIGTLHQVHRTVFTAHRAVIARSSHESSAFVRGRNSTGTHGGAPEYPLLATEAQPVITDWNNRRRIVSAVKRGFSYQSGIVTKNDTKGYDQGLLLCHIEAEASAALARENNFTNAETPIALGPSVRQQYPGCSGCAGRCWEVLEVGF